ENCQKQGKFTTMDQAGRSSQIIINAANFVLHWVNNNVNQKDNNNSKIKADLSEVLKQPFRFQNIKAVNKNDPQPNPLPTESGLELVEPTDIFESVNLIRTKAIALLKANPNHNVAVLVRENRQAHFVADQLADLAQSEDIPIYEVGSSDRLSKIPGEILGLLQFIDRPHSPDYLKIALTILQNRDLIPAQDINALAIYPEQFLYPSSLAPEANLGVKIARHYCQQLLQAKIELPHYQLIPFLGMKLNYDGSQLATLQKLSERIQQQIYLQNTLKMTIETLREIIKSERFEEVEEESDDLYTRSGQITIITMHKAKGLDWDYVFIPFLHQDSMPGDAWIPIAAKFLGDYTLSEVARAQIRTAVHHQYIYQKQVTELPNAIAAWQTAQTLKEAEAYRLFYVAMTRAKRLLWLASEQQAPFRWSIFDSQKNVKLDAKIPAPVFVALQQAFLPSQIKI
ncbi:MAG: 3'-5' exonuclease, partial [Microcystaceae cyanobacterium]